MDTLQTAVGLLTAAIGINGYFLKKHMDKVEKMDAQVQNNTTEIAVAKREKELQKEFFDKMTSNLKEYIDNKFTDIKELINAKHS